MLTPAGELDVLGHLLVGQVTDPFAEGLFVFGEGLVPSVDLVVLVHQLVNYGHLLCHGSPVGERCQPSCRWSVGIPTVVQLREMFRPPPVRFGFRLPSGEG